jgi:hypothetical protein
METAIAIIIHACTARTALLPGFRRNDHISILAREHYPDLQGNNEIIFQSCKATMTYHQGLPGKEETMIHSTDDIIVPPDVLRHTTILASGTMTH